MQCPQCGSEATGETCPACGAAVIEQSPKWYAEGIAYLCNEKQYLLAHDLLEEALQQHPTSAMLWFNGGVLEEVMGNRQMAVLRYQEALKYRQNFQKARDALDRLTAKLSASPAAPPPPVASPPRAVPPVQATPPPAPVKTAPQPVVTPPPAVPPPAPAPAPAPAAPPVTAVPPVAVTPPPPIHLSAPVPETVVTPAVVLPPLPEEEEELPPITIPVSAARPSAEPTIAVVLPPLPKEEEELPPPIVIPAPAVAPPVEPTITVASPAVPTPETVSTPPPPAPAPAPAPEPAVALPAAPAHAPVAVETAPPADDNAADGLDLRTLPPLPETEHPHHPHELLPEPVVPTSAIERWRLISKISGLLSLVAILALVVSMFMGKSLPFIIALLFLIVASILYFVSKTMSDNKSMRHRRH